MQRAPRTPSGTKALLHVAFDGVLNEPVPMRPQHAAGS
jgi:hypothetical protein